ncbi:MAG: hydrogenase [Deltaproteobacteria bacterium]|nr:hydrogenase [Deltaproteobacteria bacterium]
MASVARPAPQPIGENQVPPIMGPTLTYRSITEKLSDIILSGHIPTSWFVALAIALMGVGSLTISAVVLLVVGTGIWGITIPIGWGFAIINFVWWIGIGHAGTLISAVLHLLGQQWRTSINRFAEAMTLVAVLCAGMFPLLHTGRPWLAAYWLFPYPNTMNVWPQFRSPLIWDVFAVSTYLTVSLLFWYVGLVPDLAAMRDRAKTKVGQTIYGMLAMGWRGSALHWQRYEIAYLLLAGLSTPLVVSVHSIVSFDFAVSVIPGWHTTIFPPYFVAGAVYAGFAMVFTLGIPLRSVYKLEDFITLRHLDNMAKVMLATGLFVSYGYAMEAFISLVYAANPHEYAMMMNRMFGPYGWSYWMLVLTNIVIPQLLWFRKVRHNVWLLFLVSMSINVGMWLERFVIVVTSLHRDFLPSSWGMYYPTIWDFGIFIGTMGFFLMMMLLFVRALPAISIAEMRLLLFERKHHGKQHGKAHTEEAAV